MLNTGDRVKVCIPITELTASKALEVWNGTETIVSGIRRYQTSGSQHTYILEGVFSDYLIPHEFFEDWLIPLDEESEGRDG